VSTAVPIDLPVPTLPIAGRLGTFPVGRIYCVGRNYAAHAREMGKDPEREPPFFFMKPATALVAVRDAVVDIPYPPQTNNFHHEVELVVAIGLRAADVATDEALRHVFGYAVGLDMTRRDLQLAARDAGRPWEFGKSFARSAPAGPLHRALDIGHPHSGAIWLKVNGEARQRADISELIWSVAECISYLSRFDPLEPGDLLFTGTPAGVGAVVPGDVLHAGVDGVGEMRIRIDAPELRGVASS
jgi:fumarylpyruvate hydrolase